MEIDAFGSEYLGSNRGGVCVLFVVTALTNGEEIGRMVFMDVVDIAECVGVFLVFDVMGFGCRVHTTQFTGG